MFRGRHDHVLDDKGRTSLPKHFREELEEVSSEPSWITMFPEFIAILPDPLFVNLESGLADMGPISGLADGIRRMLIGNAEPCSVDKQGRVMIAPHLRSWAHLNREIVLNGVGNYIEIWDRSRYEDNLQKTRDSYGEWADVIAQRLRTPSP
jgi:MraZ protein